MVRRVMAGLAGLGLIGGVGAVTHNDDGSTTVSITDKNGKVHTVNIAGDGGKTFSCPDGTEAKLDPVDIRAGRIKLTLRRVDKSMSSLEKRYPRGKGPPTPAAHRYNGLLKREKQLIKAYNETVDQHNAVIDSDCDPE
jgi:hypothetical protein